jgi:plastocyanin
VSRSLRFLAAATLAAAPLAAACSSQAASPTAPGSSLAPGTTAAGGSAATGTADATVTIKDFAFGPNPITVKAGQKITFTNTDDSPHEPTSGTPTAKTSAFLVDTAANGSATTGPIQLAPGTYDYFCGLHEYMVAKLVVQ